MSDTPNAPHVPDQDHSGEGHRWDQPQAAADYDAAAPVIHPHYLGVQDAVLAAVPFKLDEAFEVVDLGGGSGRLAERILTTFPKCRTTIVDQSPPFLDLARARLAPFGQRANFVLSSIQDEAFLANDLPALAPDLIVSTSALHHLEPAEKQSVYQASYDALSPGGALINGDEFRPENDAEYHRLLDDWGRHMDGALSEGRIPASFREMIATWRQRNLENFGQPRRSGEDCHESITTQVGYLRAVGFSNVEATWQKQLWGVIAAGK